MYMLDILCTVVCLEKKIILDNSYAKNLEINDFVAPTSFDSQ